MRILCVDDHAVVREGLATIIATQPDMEVVGTANDGAHAIDAYRQWRPDVVLMDLHLPLMSGFEAIRAIRREDPQARIIVLTMYDGEEDVHRALSAGAAAYLLKDTLADDLIHTLRQVYTRPAAAGPAERAKGVALTRREEQVMQALARGLRNKEIAADMGLSQDTVQMHIKSIFSKLGVHDRTAALAVAIRRGIVHLDE
jgi:two-component system, NarL family, response regulator